MSAYRTALVTGASAGIGRGLALALAARGTFVYAAARRRAQLDELVAEIARAGGRADAFELDVSRADETEARVRELDGRAPLDLVVANAGVGLVTSGRKLDWKTVRQVLDVNLVGAAATLTGAIPGMVARGHGHVVGVASAAGLLPGVPRLAAYAASKAGLVSFLDSLRLDLRGTGVAVTALCPGYVRTDLTAGNKAPMPGLLSVEECVATMIDAIDRRVPRKVFPLAMATRVRLASVLPEGLYAAMVGARKGKKRLDAPQRPV